MLHRHVPHTTCAGPVLAQDSTHRFLPPGRLRHGGSGGFAASLASPTPFPAMAWCMPGRSKLNRLSSRAGPCPGIPFARSLDPR